MSLRVLFPFSCNNDLTSHPPFSLVRYLATSDLHAELWVARRGPRAREPFVRAGIPEGMRWCLDHANRALRSDLSWTRMLTERRFANAFRRGDAAWMYRGCSVALTKHLRDAGHPVFFECVNTMGRTLLDIIADAFARAGWPIEPPYSLDIPQDGYRANVDAADFVFSPSPAVTDSLLKHGVPREKILETSYGWDPARFKAGQPALPTTNGVTVLFVGNVGLRKGAHLLLDAWSRSGIKGRLVLAGRMESLIARRCAGQLARPDVILRDYDPDPAPVYRSADIFAFPTLEEGSPLVSYEAMGNGLPVVTSPMGAGHIIRHEQEGIIVDPYDQEGLVRALQDLAEDVQKRQRMAAAARRRGAEYTWDKVAQQRYRLFKNALRALGH
jgi:glycosyltransferase involved in cell wall biosynthesis